ncbi:hypothetical protein RM11_0741 [Bartonella quintana RM-11]|nr:hypothetical protein RM11_0741 [Bartonella quintana RM-11]
MVYLHHLIKSGESLGGMLLTWNNLFIVKNLCKEFVKPLKQAVMLTFVLKHALYGHKGDKVLALLWSLPFPGCSIYFCIKNFY